MEYLTQGFLDAIGLIVSGDEETFSAVLATLKTSTLAIIFSLVIGLPFGFYIGYFDFRGKKMVRAVVDSLMALPTVVVGLLVYGFISRKGPFGEAELLYTIPGIAVAQVILILPIIISLTATAIETLDSQLRVTLLTLGAKGKQLILAHLIEARFAIFSALVTGYGRVVSEVGISMMIGGNIKWHTRTITTAITLETGKGEFSMGIALGLILLLIAFTINSSISILKRRIS